MTALCLTDVHHNSSVFIMAGSVISEPSIANKLESSVKDFTTQKI